MSTTTMMNKVTLMSIALCISQAAGDLEVVMPGTSDPEPEPQPGTFPSLISGGGLPSGVASSKLTAPSSGGSVSTKQQQPVTDTFLENGAFAWFNPSSETEGRFQDFPPHYNADVSFQFKVPPTHEAPAGTYANYRCPNTRGPCEVIVFAYECNGCGRDLKNRALFKQLAEAEFERTRCAPTFLTGKKGGRKYQMVAYVKTLGAGKLLSVHLKEAAHFVAFAMSQGGSPACPTLPFETKGCEDDSHHRCQLKLSSSEPHCALRKCVVSGPGLGCQECPLEEYH